MIKKVLALLCALLMMTSAVCVRADQAAPVPPSEAQVNIEMVTPEPVIMDLNTGARGNEVLTLQKRLAVLGFFFTAEDGIYGANTRAAVMEFENYLRLLEQDEIDRMIEAQKTPEPTAEPEITADPEITFTPEPEATAAPSASQKAETTGEPIASADKTAEPSMEPAVTPTPEPTPEPTPVPTPGTVADGAADSALQEILYGETDALYRRDAKMADKGLDITRIQRRLTYLNYLNDEPDGSFGVNTETAVKAFQTAHGLEETGVADRVTQEKLFSEKAIRSDKPVYNQLYLWVAGEDVKTVQKQLIYLGFMNGGAKGTFDERTQNAVMLLETYLHELDQAEAGVGIPTPTGTPVPEDILEKQGEVEGDPELNPYEVGAEEPSAADDQSMDEPDEEAPAEMAGSTNAPDATETPKSLEAAELSETADEPEAGNKAESNDETNLTDKDSTPEKPEETAVPDTAEKPAASGQPTEEPTAVSPSEEPAPSAPDSSADGEGRTAPAKPDETPGPDVVSDDTDQTTGGESETDEFVPTGVVTAELQTRLLEEGIPVYRQDLLKGHTGSEVMRLQRRLYSLGYLTANGVDGIFGKGSEGAVSSFQARNKLEQTGIADQNTQAALFSEDAVRSIKPYQIRISVDKQKVYVYTHDDNDEYTILVKTFVCSTGTRDNPTPLGTFTNTGPGARWHYFRKFECWAQYAYYINGDIMFHSVLYDEKDVNTLRKGSVSALGSRASHGCVRLKVEDAKWIWSNCSAGTSVVVY